MSKIQAISTTISLAIAAMDSLMLDDDIKSLTVPEKHHMNIPGMPSASMLLKCVRKNWYRQHDMAEINPSSISPKHLLAQGILTGAYVYNAIASYPDFVNTQGEMAFTNSLINGVADIYTRHHATDATVVIEVKDTVRTQLQYAYVFQTIAYMRGLGADFGAIVMTNRYSWQVFMIDTVMPSTLEHPDQQVYAAYDAQEKKILSVSAEDWKYEVSRQKEFLGLDVLHTVHESPVHLQVDEIKTFQPECMKIEAAPHVYKTNRGDWSKGDVKPGRARITCPYAGFCWPELQLKEYVAIDIVDGKPIIVTEEEPF